MIDRLHSVDLLMDTCDNLTVDAAITMLEALGNELADLAMYKQQVKTRTDVIESQRVDLFNLRSELAQCQKELSKLKQSEPLCWITPDGEGWRLRVDPPVNDVPLGWKPLFDTPQPDRTAELETALREAREALLLYTFDGNTADNAIATIDEVLSKPY